MLREAIARLAMDEEAVHGPRLIKAKIQLAETLMALASATQFRPSSAACRNRDPATSTRTSRNCARGCRSCPPAQALKELATR